MKTPTVGDAADECAPPAAIIRCANRAAFIRYDRLALDENRGIRDPRGMLGRRLGVDMHVVTTDIAAARNLTLLVERCHIGVEAMVAAPYVSGLSVLAEDEADLGAAVIDLGAGTTTFAVFSDGKFVHVDGFALGGAHVTMDIARGLTTTLADAERLKTLFGAALSPSDDRDMVTPCLTAPICATCAHDPGRATACASSARAWKILEMVRDRLNASPFAPIRGRDPRRRREPTHWLSDLACRSSAARCASDGRGIGGLSDATKGPVRRRRGLVYPQFAYLEHCEPRRTRAETGTDGISRASDGGC